MNAKNTHQDRFRRRLAVELLEERQVLSANVPMEIVNINDQYQSDYNTTEWQSANDVSSQELEALLKLINPGADYAKKYAALTGLDEVRNLYGLDGGGQTVVVIDSGIAYNHVDLGGGFGEGYRVVGGYDFADNDFDPDDSGIMGSHGTHVAGIIASGGSAYPGVASGVDLVALRIFSDDGSANLQNLIDALCWVHENKDSFENPITTINLSVGYMDDSLGYFNQINDWFRILNDDGIFISVAAGNSFESLTDKNQLSYPAMSEYVVSAGACDTSGKLTYFTQRDEGTIFAPGQSVKSTVPDYFGNRNGIDDDYSAYSGTSMAAPYIAGASTLIRQAMQLVGIGEITQQRIYDVMIATADSVFDAVTGKTFSRLNIKNAIESILPDDWAGDSIQNAEKIGTVIDATDVNGFFNTKTDADYFSFIAGETGTVVLTPNMSAGLTGTWDASQIPGAVVGDDGSVTFRAEEGKTYSFGFNATGTIGAYTITVNYPDKIPQTPDDNAEENIAENAGHTSDDHNNAENPTNHEETGVSDLPNDLVADDAVFITADQTTLEGQKATGEGAWYAVKAANTGTMTFETILPNGVSANDILIEIGDGEGNAAESYRGTSRIDFPVAAGTTVWVRVATISGKTIDNVSIRLTNLLRQEGRDVFVFGTEANDDISFTAGTTQTLVINGVIYTFDQDVVSNISIDGRGGNDSIALIGTSDAEYITIDGVNVEISGSRYNVRAINAEYVTINGAGGDDSFRYYDTKENDQITVRTGAISIASGRFFAQVHGAAKFFAYSQRGGNDSATLYDSPDNDVFNVSATYSLFRSGGTTSQLYSFGSVVAHSINGGADTATFTDTTGESVFTGSYESMKRISANQYVEARGFVQTNLTAVFGGKSDVQLEDSVGSDTLYISSDGVSLNGEHYGISVRGFDSVHASSVNGGVDAVILYDTQNFQKIIADRNTIRLIDSVHNVEADGFGEVWGFGVGDKSSKIEKNETDYAINLFGWWEES
ncbi:MAG: S8 family serine peptidase [Planctomycetaceae bacterium]|nr:S8 family serine peptidase [Planctomycetaceae bacterium]